MKLKHRLKTLMSTPLILVVILFSLQSLADGWNETEVFESDQFKNLNDSMPPDEEDGQDLINKDLIDLNQDQEGFFDEEEIDESEEETGEPNLSQ